MKKLKIYLNNRLIALWTNKQNRKTWAIFDPFYLFYDYLYPGLNSTDSSNLYNQSCNLEKKAFYAHKFQDKAILYDYSKKIDELKKNTSNKKTQKYLTRLGNLCGKNLQQSAQKYQFGTFFDDIFELKTAELAAENELCNEKLEQEKAEVEKYKAKEKLARVANRCLLQQLMQLSEELRNAIDIESQNTILDTAINCGSPEARIRSIFKAIQANQKQVIKNQSIPDAIFEEGIKNFYTMEEKNEKSQPQRPPNRESCILS